MRKPLWRQVRRLALVVVNVGVTVFLLEVSLRIVPIPGFSDYIKAIGILAGQREGYRYDPVGDMGVFIPNRIFRWTIMDGEFDITTVSFPDNDTLGLRDDGLNMSAPHKVFACGDSFTFGFGVNDDEVWHELLEKKHGNDVDIFNLRGIGASVSSIYDRYPRYSHRFPHDTVFLGIYLGNEFIDSYPVGSNSDIAEKAKAGPIVEDVVSEDRWEIVASIYAFARRYSYTARLVKYLLFRELIRIGYYDYDVNREVYQPDGSPFVFTIDFEENILVRTCELEYSPQMKAGVDNFRASVMSMGKLLDQDRKRVYAFIFPFKEQVYWDQWAHRLERPEVYDRLRPNRIVREALEQAGIPYYDLTEDMIEAGRSKMLYWPIDAHWNAEGNRVASELIYEWLDERGFPH